MMQVPYVSGGRSHVAVSALGHRVWRRLLPALASVVLLLPLFAGRARAVDAWCADDPVVSVNGQLLDIQLQMPLANLLTMRSTTLTVIIPSNVTGAVVLDDVSAFPMHTSVSPTGPAWSGAGAVPITIQAWVVATTSYPERVVATPVLNLTTPLAPPATASGTANSLLTLLTAIG